MSATETVSRFSDEDHDEIQERIDSFSDVVVIEVLIGMLEMLHRGAETVGSDGMHNAVTVAKIALTSVAMRDLTVNDYAEAFRRAFDGDTEAIELELALRRLSDA